jgi:hypothetical protein
VALLVVLGESIYDVDELAGDGDRSIGGWSMILAAAGLLGGGFALRVLHPTPRRLGIVSGIAATVALGWSSFGVAVLVPQNGEYEPSATWVGVGLLVAALLYLGLAGSVFGRGRLRNLSTTHWALGLLALVAAEGFLLQDGRAFAAATALTGALVALVALPLRELRLALAGAIATGLATLGTLAFITPLDHFLEATMSPADGLWVLVACVAGAAAVAIVCLAAGRPEVRWAGIVVGGLALYAVSLGVLGLVVDLSGASVEADFERGHTVVSALWALVGLVGLVAGLVRGSSVLRFAGLGLFGVSLAKIFLYDLSELSSVARAASFIAVGAAILAGGAVLQKLSARLEEARGEPNGPASGASAG